MIGINGVVHARFSTGTQSYVNRTSCGLWFSYALTDEDIKWTGRRLIGPIHLAHQADGDVDCMACIAKEVL